MSLHHFTCFCPLNMTQSTWADGERSGKRSGASRKSIEWERSGEQAWQRTIKQERRGSWSGSGALNGVTEICLSAVILPLTLPLTCSSSVRKRTDLDREDDVALMGDSSDQLQTLSDSW